MLLFLSCHSIKTPIKMPLATEIYLSKCHPFLTFCYFSINKKTISKTLRVINVIIIVIIIIVM